MGFLDDAISSLGRGLAKTAAQSLKDATGFDVGGTLNALFGGDQKMGGEDLQELGEDLQNNWTGSPDQLTILQNSVDQQLAVVGGLGEQLQGLATAIGNLQAQIANVESLLEGIGQEQLYQEWSQVDQQLTNYLAAIETSFQTYGEYIAAFASTDTPIVQSLVSNILDMNDGPRVGLTAISRFTVDDGQARGVLQLWSNMVVPLINKGIIDYRDAAEQYIQYYQKLAYAQLQATNLVMEAYNFSGDPQLAGNIWSQYRQCLLNQESCFITWLYPLLTAGAQSGANRNVTWSSCDAGLQLNPSIQLLTGAPSGSPTYYQPSSILQGAENLLATLYLTDSAERRIVVHMVCNTNLSIGGLLDAVELTLSPSDAGNVVSGLAQTLPVTYSMPGSASQGGIPDLNFFPFPWTFQVRRFVFTASSDDVTLADGNYCLTNLNGTNGLVPIETYLSSGEDGGEPGEPDPQFLHESVLGNTLSINPSQPFAFMNFVAYVLPMTAPWQL